MFYNISLKKETTELGHVFCSSRANNLNLLRFKKRENLVISDPFDFRHLTHIGLDKDTTALKSDYQDLVEIKKKR